MAGTYWNSLMWFIVVSSSDWPGLFVVVPDYLWDRVQSLLILEVPKKCWVVPEFLRSGKFGKQWVLRYCVDAQQRCFGKLRWICAHVWCTLTHAKRNWCTRHFSDLDLRPNSMYIDVSYAKLMYTAFFCAGFALKSGIHWSKVVQDARTFRFWPLDIQKVYVLQAIWKTI